MLTNITMQQAAVFLALLAIFVPAHARITSATLGDPSAERNLIRIMKFPETDGDATVQLECQSIVTAKGRMKDAGCYLKNNWDPDFAEAVQKAAKKAQLVPARDGKTGKVVVLLFQVEFLKKDDEKTITVYLNPGNQEMLAEYGPDHIYAQRVMGRESWQKACPKHADWLIYAQAHINEEGVASSVDLAHGGGIVPAGPCQQAIIDTIASSQFAPATLDAVPVPSSYIEPFGN